jgi:type IV pilus assembly protein PilN
MNGPLLGAINLASQPFRRERAQNAVLAGVCAALVCSLLVLASLVIVERKQAAGLRQTISAERSELQKLQRQGAQFSTVLGRPENADVFARSVFLNELIARRAVSWTVVFRDLEKTLPPNMRLIGVRLPQVAGGDADGTDRVQLDMVLGTDRPEALIELLKKLAGSNLFGSAQVLGQQPPTQNDPLYKYRVTVTYAQKL